ncbi:MAG: aminotransferase class V-fold PLP-dependent enzyme [Candidatus Obscuribacterales bacterium]|nr:aminotransferase class V-fold PLP-dependent enzyme [Candidatus Obscuribacterales bacterium]
MNAKTCPIPHGSKARIKPAIDEVAVLRLRQEFPIFGNSPDVIFFDNAATAQKPERVLRRVSRYYRHECANAGRSAYRASTTTAAAIEDCREKVAAFINTKAEQIAFTSGATDSLNTVALGWGLTNLKDGDEIMVCFEDHKSAVMPWFNVQSLLSRFGISVKIVPFDIHHEGDYELKSIRENLTARTKLLAMTHIHHLYGLDMEVEQIREIVGQDVLISLDVSQSIGHRKVDVSALPVDFVSFSGHKMFSGTGVGVLWTSPRARRLMHAVKSGSTSTGANLAVPNHEPTLASIVESGTPNVAAVLSLAPAIDFVERWAIERIEERISGLSHYLRDALSTLEGVDFAPGFGRCGCPAGYGVISFRLEQIATSDLAFVLDSENIQVRTGNFCLSKRNQGDDYARISLHVYNTKAEVDRFINVLQGILN